MSEEFQAEIEAGMRNAFQLGFEKGRDDLLSALTLIQSIAVPLPATNVLEKSFDEGEHPRDDIGCFVSKDKISAAAKDPDKAAELRKTVTDPEQRKKLDAAIDKKGKEKVDNDEEVDNNKQAKKKGDSEKVTKIRKTATMRKTDSGSLAAAVRSSGGIDPKSLDFLKFHTGVNEAMEYGIPLSVFRKGGLGLDVLAAQLHENGIINTPEGKDHAEHLLEKLAEKAKSDLADNTKEIEEAYHEHARNEYLASLEHSPDEIASAARLGEEAGKIEDDPDSVTYGGGSSREFGGGSGDALPETAGTDFEFGANEGTGSQQASKPAKPKRRTVEQTVTALERIGKRAKLRATDLAIIHEAINGHTHAEIAEVKKRLGIKASGAKAKQAADIANRIIERDRSDARKFNHPHLTVDEAKAHVDKFIANTEPKPGDAVRLANALAGGLTTKQLLEVKKHYGIKASGAKSEMALKIAKKLAPTVVNDWSEQDVKLNTEEQAKTESIKADPVDTGNLRASIPPVEQQPDNPAPGADEMAQDKPTQLPQLKASSDKQRAYAEAKRAKELDPTSSRYTYDRRMTELVQDVAATKTDAKFWLDDKGPVSTLFNEKYGNLLPNKKFSGRALDIIRSATEYQDYLKSTPEQVAKAKSKGVYDTIRDDSARDLIHHTGSQENAKKLAALFGLKLAPELDDDGQPIEPQPAKVDAPAPTPVEQPTTGEIDDYLDPSKYTTKQEYTNAEFDRLRKIMPDDDEEVLRGQAEMWAGDRWKPTPQAGNYSVGDTVQYGDTVGSFRGVHVGSDGKKYGVVAHNKGQTSVPFDEISHHKPTPQPATTEQVRNGQTSGPVTNVKPESKPVDLESKLKGIFADYLKQSSGKTLRSEGNQIAGNAPISDASRDTRDNAERLHRVATGNADSSDIVSQLGGPHATKSQLATRLAKFGMPEKDIMNWIDTLKPTGKAKTGTKQNTYDTLDVAKRLGIHQPKKEASPEEKQPAPTPTPAPAPAPVRRAMAYEGQERPEHARFDAEQTLTAEHATNPQHWDALAAAGKRDWLIQEAKRRGVGDEAKKMPARKIVELLRKKQG